MCTVVLQDILLLEYPFTKICDSHMRAMEQKG